MQTKHLRREVAENLKDHGFVFAAAWKTYNSLHILHIRSHSTSSSTAPYSLGCQKLTAKSHLI